MENQRRHIAWDSILIWVIILLLSILPEVISSEIFKVNIQQYFWVKIPFLACFVLLTLLINPLRKFLKFGIIMLVFFFMRWFIIWLGNGIFWKSIFGWGSGPFHETMLSTQALQLVSSLVVTAALALVFRSRKAFFFYFGDTNAEAKPIPLLMTSPNHWGRLGWILAACLSGGTLVFLVIGGFHLFTSSVWRWIPPIIPFVLLFAVMNAFSEEMNYRVTILSTLKDSMGEGQANLMAAVLFGIGHFYGVPYGILGVLMATILGWFLGKSMLETKGMFWAWFIHFLQDVAIFFFMALGMITPGG